MLQRIAPKARLVPAPNYGLLSDTFHANIEDKDPIGVIAPNIAHINHVHFSENDRGTPGKGHIPWAARMKARKQMRPENSTS
jgi:D-psicose/D-tagatose/L-ribulose 3-epimerase